MPLQESEFPTVVWYVITFYDSRDVELRTAIYSLDNEIMRSSFALSRTSTTREQHVRLRYVLYIKEINRMFFLSGRIHTNWNNFSTRSSTEVCPQSCVHLLSTADLVENFFSPPSTVNPVAAELLCS